MRGISCHAFIGALLLVLLVSSGCGQGRSNQESAEGEVRGGTARQSEAGNAKGTAFAGQEIVPPLPAPEFRLLDRDGKRLALKDLRGKVVLLGFAYTGCPDVCPRLAKSFLAVQKEMGGALGRDLELVFISVDPEGDTLERADKWTEAQGGRWHYLVGERRVLEKVWDDYGVVVEKGANGSVGHSVKTYLIDGRGLVRVRYGGLGWEKAALADIKRLLGR